MSFVGYEIDSIAQEVRLPLDKLQKCSQEIEMLLQQSRATLREIQSIVGLLNFTCAVVLPGRPFLRRLIDLTIGVAAPHFKIRLTKGSKEDLRIWLQFLFTHNGKCLFLDQQPIFSPDINLYTDASGSVGYGAICGSEWFQGEWSEWWQGQNITLLELYPIVVAIEAWGPKLENKQLVLHTDNIAIVAVLQKQTSKEPLVMTLVRKLVLLCLKYNLVVSAQHVPGENNSIADALSRFQMERFRNLCSWAEAEAICIPPLPAALV